MKTPNFLKKRGNRIWISLITLAVLIVLYFYFAIKEKDFTLNLLNKYFVPEISNQLIVIVPVAIGLIVIPFLINFITTDLGATFDEKPEEKEQIPASIPVEITVKTENPQPETKPTKTIPNPNQKFYPSSFIPDLKFFVGRKKLLSDLKKKLETKHRASIHDISGLGKTFTTYKFAEDNQNNYDKIFFVRANKEEMLQSLAEMGVSLNPFLRDEPDQSKQAQGFRNWLEENEKWLVIYDNVDMPSELKPFAPNNKQGDCIFTSNFNSITNLAEEIRIEKLEEIDAEILLFSRVNNQPNKEPSFSNADEQIAFENIVKEIDGLPLSLNTTGAFINKKNISFAEYWQKLQKTPDILLENEDGFDNYHRKSALKAFSIAFDDICTKKPDDEFKISPYLAADLLFTVGFIAPDNIPENFLREILQDISKPKNILIKILQKILGIREHKDLWLEIRNKLLAYDLLKYDNSTKLFMTHRLIQKVIQTKQPNIGKKAICYVVLIVLDKLFPVSDYGNWEECDLYLPHSVSALKFAENLKLTSYVIGNNYFKIGTHLNERLQYQQSINYLNKAVENFQEIFGKENKRIANCLDSLGRIYYLQNRYDKAIEFYKEALQIGEKTFGKRHHNYGKILNDLAIVYLSQKKYDVAIKTLEEALQVGEKTLGKQHCDYAALLNTLATIYSSQSKYDKAINLYKESLQIFEKTLGRKHPDYAKGLNNLAEVYFKQGKYNEAFPIFDEAYEIGVKTLGVNHPSTQGFKRDLELCRVMPQRKIIKKKRKKRR